MKKLNLDILKEGLPGVSPTRGAFYREAVIVALSRQGFRSGTKLKLSGELQEIVLIEWLDDIDAKSIESWRDEVQIVNFGAVGIAVLIMYELYSFKNFEEGTIGTGIDFWMSKKDFQDEQTAFYQREARLEISGILEENIGNTVGMRVSRKKKQMIASDHLELPGWVIVVEFSTPKSKIIKK